MNIKRRKSRIVKIGSILIGGDNPIAIQSMAKVKTSDVSRVIAQIQRLKEAGCQIVRLAVKDKSDAQAIKKIKTRSKLVLVADIHFDWRLALKAIDSGIDKIRLNPGNIYKKEEIREIVRAAKLNQIPIRVGVNSGSLKSSRLAVSATRHGGSATFYGGHSSQPERMVKSVLDYIKFIEKQKFYDLVISLKASNVLDTVEAYRLMAKSCDYPLHLGVTATGAPREGAIKSSIALGILLSEGIGDTIRVSLTDKPEEEVRVAKNILDSLGLKKTGIEIISCPTCGRCEVDLVKIVRDLENKLATSNKLSAKPLTVAVMGCVVNGPGEARQADIGVAFGKKEGLLFHKGKAITKVSVGKCIDSLLEQIKK